MDDCCVIFAEPLEWVAYGLCLHREVCSTCVARLRFICDDRLCCICKTECNLVFAAKDSDYNEVNRGECQFATMASVLDNDTQGMPFQPPEASIAYLNF
ncbi:hypothetical protein JHK87_027159 [Glycine soja]|nr:hypothetical protein JHK87_027159 [Glycine soja]